MVRPSKQSQIRAVSKWRPSPPAKKTGAKKDALAQGFKVHANAVEGDAAKASFIPKIK
ncbi:MAG: hypothetical protein HYX67_15635 [Candidatus Melainabacteria bacterium]|nr:hypothetical protein [Candidatus Melainabacteria bacterium]